MHFHCAIEYPSILQPGSFAWMCIGIVKDHQGDSTATYVGNLKENPSLYTIRTAQVPELRSTMRERINISGGNSTPAAAEEEKKREERRKAAAEKKAKEEKDKEETPVLDWKEEVRR